MGLRGGHEKKTGLIGGPAKKILSVRGVTQKITLKWCNNSIYDGLKKLNSERLTVRLGLTVYNFQYFVRHDLFEVLCSYMMVQNALKLRF